MSNPIYPGSEWMPVEGEEVYSPVWGSYGVVKRVNRGSVIVDVEAEGEWHELQFDHFHKSRREENRRERETLRKKADEK